MSISRGGIERTYGTEFVGGNDIRIFHDGQNAFRSIIDEIEQAEKYIFLVFYIFRNDITGREIGALLRKKASQGIRVCVLYDHFGSFMTSWRFWSNLAASGVEVRSARPLKINALGDYVHRDHRKLIVVDGRAAFTGGINIADEYSGHFFKHKRKGWRDTVVRIEGPVALKLHEIFKNTWRLWKGRPIDDGDIGARSSGKGMQALPIFSSSSKGRKHMRTLLYWCIENAQYSIYLTTAYFTPSLRMMTVLREAVQRGVKVKLLLPSYSDLKTVMYAGRASFTRLLKWGIEIYLYQKSVLHAKSYVFDSIFSIIGSANLDFQSLRKNDEGNIGVYDGQFAQQLERIFDEDMKHSVKIELPQWSKRPLVNKMLEKFFVMFRRRL